LQLGSASKCDVTFEQYHISAGLNYPCGFIKHLICLHFNQTSGEDGKSENIRCADYCLLGTEYNCYGISECKQKIKKTLETKPYFNTMARVAKRSFQTVCVYVPLEVYVLATGIELLLLGFKFMVSMK